MVIRIDLNILIRDIAGPNPIFRIAFIHVDADRELTLFHNAEQGTFGSSGVAAVADDGLIVIPDIGLGGIEFCTGVPLDKIIMQAVNEHNDGILYEKLTALAAFLATVHNRSARPVGVDFYSSCSYFDATLQSASTLMDSGEYQYFRDLKERWIKEPAVWQDQQVLTHGDATPSNFLFGDGMYVISFDLERARRTDRVFDVGRIVAELQHFFLRSTGNKYAAEPFIGHFLWEYAGHFPDRDSAFASINARIPFYSGTNLLRISRNTYLDVEYRRLLIEEAKLALRK